MTKLICGIGINDADYSISSYDVAIGDRGNKKKGKRLWICPFIVFGAACYTGVMVRGLS